MNPDKYTISETMLKVSDGHELYVQVWGNKKGTPILYLHGGPGSGCNDRNKKLFNPDKHLVVFFDQRGSGKSLPTGSLENNTTKEMVEDINKVLGFAGLKKVTIVGGSWGSTLALCYAIEQPKRVERLVVRGVFTGTKEEADHINYGGFRKFFPEVWEEFVNSVPKSQQSDPAAYHAKKIFGEDRQEAKKAAFAFGVMESSIVNLDDRNQEEDFETFEPSSSIIEMHYVLNGCFLEDDYILNHAHELKMPINIVQGRYDFVCPPITAYNLSKLAPNARLQMTAAGHNGWDRENYIAMKAILDNL